MSFTLRPYQARAVSETIEYFRNESRPGCLVLPTGAGKSLIIAELSRRARGRVLVVTHVKELCDQNHRKFESLGETAGIYSAGLGQKNATSKVTFCSVQSLAPHLDDFREPLSLLIIDECHRVSDASQTQYGTILAVLNERNPGLKILGLTATPYRMNMGFCYRVHAKGVVRTEEERPFHTCIFEVELKDLIRAGYLTEPQVRAPDDYTTLLEQAEPDSRDRATPLIIRHIVDLAQKENRRGVMIFAATTKHAAEIVSLLPAGQAALVLGDTPDVDRDQQIKSFCNQKLRYLVNVAVLTTGFDAPHVDFIALLRKTESVSLYQQIVGRGLRLFPGKKNCLVIDYAKNGYDLYSPEVGERRPHPDAEVVRVPCPECEHENEFWGRLDSDGTVVEHYGRRCTGRLAGELRCTYRFRFKECPRCGGENDIAARNCNHCPALLVDPDEMLKRALQQKDTMVLRVSGVDYQVRGARLRLAYHDEDGQSVAESFDFSHDGQRSVFNRVFARRLASGRRPLELSEPEQAVQLQYLLPRPDFIVARRKRARDRKGSYFVVERRVFDYDGNFRRADSAR